MYIIGDVSHLCTCGCSLTTVVGPSIQCCSVHILPAAIHSLA